MRILVSIIGLLMIAGTLAAQENAAIDSAILLENRLATMEANQTNLFADIAEVKGDIAEVKTIVQENEKTLNKVAVSVASIEGFIRGEEKAKQEIESSTNIGITQIMLWIGAIGAGLTTIIAATGIITAWPVIISYRRQIKGTT